MWWSTMTGKLEQARGLDPVADGVARGVNAVLRPGTVKDVLHGRWLGHPVHPFLVAGPIGFWVGASLLDLTAGGAGSRRAARRLVGAGVLVAVPTATAGLADWSALGAFQRPKRVGLVHGLANALTVAVYGASWLARRGGDHALGRRLALAGTAGLGVAGYLGGHLAYSEGVGVNRNADQQKKPQQWTDAAPAALVVEGGLHRVDVEGVPVVLTRRAGAVLAFTATCSHYGGPLQDGQIVDGCVVCPWHGSRFRLDDGTVARGPATAPQTTFETRAAGDRIEIRAPV